MGWGQILTLKNDPTYISVSRVFIKYILQWDGVGLNFNVEKCYHVETIQSLKTKYELVL